MVSIRLIHPVSVTLQIDRDQENKPVKLLAQVTWKRHAETALYQNVCEEHFAGSLTFQDDAVDSFIRSRTLQGARITAIAGADYTHAGLTIRQVLPMAHQAGIPRLIKAFFDAEVFPAGRQEDAPDILSCSDINQ